MKRHSSSLFISVVLHLLLATLLIVAYQNNFQSQPKQEQEHLLCVQLSTCECASTNKATTTPIKNLQTHKTIVKKTEKKPKIHKKVIKKVVKTEVVKKVAIKKLPPKSKEVLKNSQAPQTQAVKKRVQKPIIKSAPQQTNEEIYVDANIQKIIKLLQNNLYYPKRARRRGIQGDVRVKFHLSTDATISDITVLSSDDAILSRGAIQTIENLSQKFPHPKEDLTLTLPINYHFKH